ncbi:MAG TPA: DUF6270 domain-containing protein [Kangiella sp.]
MSFKILTVGSSLSKGVFDFVSKEESLVYQGSILNCSLASFKLKPLKPLKIKSLPTSKQKILDIDCSKSLITKIKSYEYDYLLIDFIDERFDIFVSSSGRGCAITSSEQKSVLLKEDGLIVKAFSDEAFDLWLKGWKKLLSELIKSNSYHKIIINEVYWEQGITENKFLKNIYKEVRKYIPSTQFISINKGEFSLDTQHPWGSGPIHFEKAFYESIHEKILKIIMLEQKQLDLKELHGTYKKNEHLVKQLLSLNLANDLHIGEQIIESGLISFKGFKDYTFTTPFNWNIDPFNSRTWLWNLHQFIIVKPLLSYDVNYSSLEGYKIIKDLLHTWAGLYVVDNKVEPAWHDHATALRARNLFILFLYCLNNYGRLSRNLGGEFESDFKFLVAILQLHIQLISNENFYSKGTNHGLDQSLVLYELTAFFSHRASNSNLNILAASRIAYELSNAFNDDGGHSENSPGYLNFGIKQMVEALTIKNNFKDGVEIPIKGEILELATKALTYITKPNGMLPQIGDTVDFKVNDIFNSEVQPSISVYDNFKYSISKGKKGSMPKDVDLILEKTGYAILRDKWRGLKDFSDSFHLVMKSGFLSNYHRQDDDTSFVLYAYGEDWFIDSGLYKYEEKNPYRIYMRSSDAHNLSVPYRVKASRSKLRVRSKLKLVDCSSDVSKVQAKTNMFLGYKIIRTIEHNKCNNSFKLFDSVKPTLPSSKKIIDKKIENKAVTYVTRFHVPKDKKFKIDGHVVTIMGGKKNLVLTINYENQFRVSRHCGRTSPNIIGWRSYKSGAIDKARVIELRFFDRTLDVSYDLQFQDIEVSK